MEKKIQNNNSPRHLGHSSNNQQKRINNPKLAINKNTKPNDKKKPIINKKDSIKEKKPHLKINNDIKIYSLGGLGVIGMNMYVIEQNDEILIIDAGILFADDDAHGVNYIIPDFTYLKENEKRIIGLFITHGHEDHIGALPFLLEKVHIPAIYANGLAIGLIEKKMLEFPNVKYHLTQFYDDSIYKFKNFEVSFFRTNHSIPDSFGIAIKTNLGYVVSTGDFKFDFSPIGKMSDYYKMTKLGHDGVLCLLSESTNANIPQFSSSERKIGETLANLFHQIEGRIIVATFASNVYRVRQIIESSIECGRQVVVFGHSMEQTIEVASKLKYINFPKGSVLYARQLKKIESDHITILCTGSQGEPMAALSRIASGTHKQITLQPNDTIIYSSKPIPGNEQMINRYINKLVHAGAHVIRNSPLTDIHTTGHASQNELRMMLSFMQPQYFMPIHGEYLMLKRHVELATELGIKKENCFVLGSGDVLAINQKKQAKVTKHAVPAYDIYLDSELSDVDSDVLKERKKMADDGLVTATLYINKQKELVSDIKIVTKGFATPNESIIVNKKIANKTNEIYKGLINSTKLNEKSLEKQIANQISQYIFSYLNRKPLINVSLIKIGK